MRGAFKQDFNKSKIESLAEYLKNEGVSFNLEWKTGNKVISPESNVEANAVAFKINDKPFFSWFKKNGMVIPKHFQQDKREVLFKGLAELGLYTKPDFTLGIILALVYCVLFFVAVMPGMAEMGETIIVVRIVLFILLYMGIFLLYSKNFSLVVLGIILAFPGFLGGSPSSLLNMPLLLNASRSTLYHHVKPYIK